MKKHWLKAVLAVAAVAALVSCGMLARQVSALWGAHCVTRVSFTGLDNLLHTPYEYYALDGKQAVKVSRRLIQLTHGEALERDIYADTDTSYWFVELEYAADGRSFTDSNALSSTYGPKYRIVYNNWTRNSSSPETEDLTVMRQAIEALHDGDPENWVWEGGGARGLTNFLLIRHEDHYLLQHEDAQLLALAADGTQTVLMDVPEGGRFDYYFFP